jgi:hypothetical protein
VAFRLPSREQKSEWKQLLGRVFSLYQRRSTAGGLRDFCEIYTGTRPHVFEAFHERRLWQLEHPASTLGFGTGLAPALPDGMIVPGFIDVDPALRGLRGEYYSGVNFDRLEWTQVDRFVDFDWELGSPVPNRVAANLFSVRWTGQIQPRYSELYTFRTLSDDGVRLRIDGRLIIDDWRQHARTENAGEIALDAGRWYPITLEYFDATGAGSISLSWSSRSQAREVIPRERLYAIVDESARLDGTSDDAVVVGQTIVGESGPARAADFGASLFSDTAHLFTVLAPAAKLAQPANRELFKQIVEDERPAHTDFHLCLVDARMRVGFQSRVGIDAIVAGCQDAMALDASRLGVESYLGDGDDDATGGVITRVGKRARVGRDSVAGYLEQR